MSFWVELHCDSGLHPADACGDSSCVSKSGNQPGVMMRLASNVQLAPAMLTESAKKRGWQRRRGGWWCPVCIKVQEKG